MSIIKSLHGTDLNQLTVTRQQEFELLQDIYTGTLKAAAELHNARHPLKVEYRITFSPGTVDTPIHSLATELSIGGTWHMLSRHNEKINASDRMTPRLVVYRRALAEVAVGHLIVALSNLVDPVTLHAENTEAPVVQLIPEPNGAAA